MGGEDALGLGVEVVGAVAQVIGKAQDGSLMGDKDMASRPVNNDRLATQVAQCSRIVHLADRESLISSSQRHCQGRVGHSFSPHDGGQFHASMQHVEQGAQGCYLVAPFHRSGDVKVSQLFYREMIGVGEPIFPDFIAFFRIFLLEADVLAWGIAVLAENCHIYGPGYYPHRVTVVKSETEELPREEGRHNLVSVMIFFASESYPAEEYSRSIVFRNMIVENAGHVLEYTAGNSDNLQSGDFLKELTFENVRFTGLERSSCVHGSPENPLAVRLKNVTAEFSSGTGSLFSEDSTCLSVTG